MIAYTTIGSNDLDRSKSFYDAVIGAVGGKLAMQTDRGLFYAAAPNTPMIGVMKPFDGQAATVGNGMMVTLSAGSKENVEKLHEVACANGGTCDGKPGPRGQNGQFYMAYFRDPDGNKLAAFAMNS